MAAFIRHGLRASGAPRWPGVLRAVVIGSGQTRQARDAPPWKVTESQWLHCVCLSQTDYLILLGPTLPEQSAVYGPRAQSITYSYSLKIIAAHLLLPVQLVMARLGGDIRTAVLKPSNSFSMATNWGGWRSHQPPRSRRVSTPTRAHPPHVSGEQARLAQCLGAFRPKLALLGG